MKTWARMACSNRSTGGEDGDRAHRRAGEGAASVDGPELDVVLAGRDVAGAGGAIDDPVERSQVAVGVVGAVQRARDGGVVGEEQAVGTIAA